MKHYVILRIDIICELHLAERYVLLDSHSAQIHLHQALQGAQRVGGNLVVSVGGHETT